MTEHTPGPWRNRPDTHELVGNGGRVVCWFDHKGLPSQADADVMTAAPELLEALTQCLIGLDPTTVRQARAAIAKAKGG